MVVVVVVSNSQADQIRHCMEEVVSKHKSCELLVDTCNNFVFNRWEKRTRSTVVSYQIEFFIKMSAAFLALSFLHNLGKDGGKKGSSHFDEKLSF